MLSLSKHKRKGRTRHFFLFITIIKQIPINLVD